MMEAETADRQLDAGKYEDFAQMVLTGANEGIAEDAAVLPRDMEWALKGLQEAARRLEVATASTRAKGSVITSHPRVGDIIQSADFTYGVELPSSSHVQIIPEHRITGYFGNRGKSADDPTRCESRYRVLECRDKCDRMVIAERLDAEGNATQEIPIAFCMQGGLAIPPVTLLEGSKLAAAAASSEQ